MAKGSKCSLSMCPLWAVAFVFVMIGALDWGLIGVFEYSVIDVLLNQWPLVERIFYILIGLSGLYLLVNKLMGGCKK